MKHIIVFFGMFLAYYHFLVSAAEVMKKLQLVCNMELLVISSMSEVGREQKVCFGAFLRLTKVFLSSRKINCDLRPPLPHPLPP